MTDPERIADAIAQAIEKVRTDNRLEAMWTPEIIDPEIPMNDEELDRFIATFAQNEQGERLQTWITGGSTCEARNLKEDELDDKRCNRLAVASVDWYGVSLSDSVLVCRDDVRFVYRSIMTEDVGYQGLTPTLTINGKAIPRIPAEEM